MIRFAIVVVTCFVVATLGTAGPITISLYPSPGPRTASSSFGAYRDNALASLEGGGGINIGDPNATPSAYAYLTSLIAQDLVNSNGGAGPTFNSWMGAAFPAGTFANEYGTQLLFDLRIVGNGTRFDISNIAFTSTSTDPAGLFAFSNGNLFGASGYSSSRVGVIYGPTGSKTFITSGPSTQLVDEFDYVGVGLSLDATGATGTNQQKLDSITAMIAGNEPFSITGTYIMRDSNGLPIASGTGMVNIGAVPEPATFPMTATAVLVVLAMGGKRTRTLRWR